MAAEQIDNSRGRLKLANATPFTWKRCRQGSKGMPTCNFPEIVQPGETHEVHITFKGGESAHGQVGYEVEIEEGESDNDNPTFTIAANRDGLMAQLPPKMQNCRWWVVPPVPHKIAEKDWKRGSIVSFTIGALGGQHPNVPGRTTRSFQGIHLAPIGGPPEVLPKKGKSYGDEKGDFGGFLGNLGCHLQGITESMCASVGAPNRPAGGVGEGSWTQQWMKTYSSAIADLRLDDMSIPGTHDSGTAEMSNPIVGPWASTQCLSIPAQLKAGVRALDIRVGYVGPKAQENEKVHDGIAVVHDTHPTSLSLREALVAVKHFVKRNPSEVVLLDFHRFPELGHGPPHEKAAMVVVDVLNDVMIDPKHRHQPFGKLLNQKGRVAVLWNAKEARNPQFWPGVRQAWNGADNIRNLHALASTELSEKKRGLWSMPLVLPAGVPMPVPHIAGQLDEWIAVGGLWQNNASIVAVDFVEETQLVRNCISGCLMKAVRAHASETATPSRGGGGHGGGRGRGGGRGPGGGGGHGGGRGHGGGGKKGGGTHNKQNAGK